MEVDRLGVNALPDARILQDDRGRLLLLVDPTERYQHGVLGDRIEASGIALVITKPRLQFEEHIEIPTPQVIEGLAPIWTDIDGDGEREILVTVSDAEFGARLVVYSEAGEILASSAPVGQGYRWRNQLAVLPGDASQPGQIIEVITPHLGGILNLHTWDGGRLVSANRLFGFTTHVLGSRNLDLGIMGDFAPVPGHEILLPTQDRLELALIGVGSQALEALGQVSLGGLLSTNLAAVELSDGSLVLGAGRQDGILRIWTAP